MGQRLVIQIKDGDTKLANAYYHWSGYTSSASGLVNRVLLSLYVDVNPAFTDIQKAVWALYKTGARMNDIEKAAAEKENYDFEPISFIFDGADVNRNDGLLAVSQEGQIDNVNAEEMHVDIDIQSREVYFGVIDMIPIEDYIKECEYQTKNQTETYFPSIDKLPILKCSDLPYISLNDGEWTDFYNQIWWLIKHKDYVALMPSKDYVVSFVE